MPFHWTGAALLRTAAAVSMTAWLSSTLTTAISSRMLLEVDDAALPTAASVIDAQRKRSASGLLASQREHAARERAQREQLATTLATIVDNNVFCPSCRMQPATPTSPTDALPAPTSLPLRLLATMQSDEPLDSLASVEDTQLEHTGIYGVHDELRPGVSIAAIGAGAVMLRSPTGLQRLEFGAPEPAAAKPKRKAETKQKSKRGSVELAGARAAISCEQHACTVEREFVDKLLASPAQLTRQARFVPSVRDGQARGFRVYRVRRGSLPQLLGLKNGDTLLSVNGTSLDSMDAAIRLYTRLRRASHLSAMVERKGEVFELQLDIR